MRFDSLRLSWHLADVTAISLCLLAASSSAQEPTPSRTQGNRVGEQIASFENDASPSKPILYKLC